MVLFAGSIEENLPIFHECPLAGNAEWSIFVVVPS